MKIMIHSNNVTFIFLLSLKSTHIQMLKIPAVKFHPNSLLDTNIKVKGALYTRLSVVLTNDKFWKGPQRCYTRGYTLVSSLNVINTSRWFVLFRVHASPRLIKTLTPHRSHLLFHCILIPVNGRTHWPRNHG